MENKIQAYRKKLGMSQEELGERLFVSRQTVSQWENGQTQPTLDNLIRLRELFGVSIDELMGFAEPEKETPTESVEVSSEPIIHPIERHEVQYSYSEVLEITSIGLNKIIRKLVGSAIFMILIFVWATNIEHPELFLIIVGMLLANVIINIKQLIVYRGATKRAAKKMVGKKYSFELFKDRLVLTISDDSGDLRKETIRMSDIAWVRETRTFAVFEYNGLLYALRRSQIPEFSVLYSALKDRESYKPRPKSPALRAWGIVFFVLSLASIMIGLIISVLLGIAFPLDDGTPAFLERLWGFYLAIPIPVISIAIGIMLEKRGMPYKKNIVAATIMIPLLIIYGSLFMLSEPIYSPNPIVTVEEQLKIDIPDDAKWTESRQYNQAIVYFTLNEAELKEFEAKMDNRWMTEIPETQKRLHLSDKKNYERVLLYNITTNEYNSVPFESGDYTFIAMYYDPDSQFSNLIIAQYDIQY